MKVQGGGQTEFMKHKGEGNYFRRGGVKKVEGTRLQSDKIQLGLQERDEFFFKKRRKEIYPVIGGEGREVFIKSQIAVLRGEKKPIIPWEENLQAGRLLQTRKSWAIHQENGGGIRSL